MWNSTYVKSRDMDRLRQAEMRLTRAVSSVEASLSRGQDMRRRGQTALARIEEVEDQMTTAIRHLRDLIRKRDNDEAQDG
ncbi:MAG: hypothetical protein V2I43_28225 [Parvularcula sp.]|jgi:hypothetical protein|nr:hypothetical protein [Parvularcula sp.]